MPNGEDWILSPVLEGCCLYESLMDGTLTIHDVARMNDALSVRSENRRRWSDRNK